LKFDAAGNKQIIEALKASGKQDRLRFDVSGDLQGDTLKVNLPGAPRFCSLWCARFCPLI